MDGAHDGRWDEIARGWKTIVSAGFGAWVGLTGLGFYTFGAFVKPLSTTFGWSRGQVALGLSCITLGTIVMSPLVGALMDRFGARRLALPSLVGIGLSYALFSQVNGAIISFYLACFTFSILGAATSPVTWTRAVTRYFDRNRGLALGLTLMGSACASLIGVPVVGWVIQHHGWRAAYLAMAAFTLLVAFPIVLFFMHAPAKDAKSGASPQSGILLAHAVRRAPFWILGFGAMILITAQSGTVVHLVPLLTDRGLAPVEAAGIAGLLGVAILGSRAMVGGLLDRFHPPAVAGIILLAPAISAVMLATGGSSKPWLIVAVLLQGLSSGAEIDLLSFFAGRFFGMRAYGKIYGALFAMFSVGNGLGAPIVGAIFDHAHSYRPALWLTAILFLIGAALFASLTFWPFPTEEAFARDAAA
jgi:predicted MFS family arabinose efflux permease